MERGELAHILVSNTHGGALRGPEGATLLREADPLAFKRSLAGLAAGDGAVLLGDPSWGSAESLEAARLLRLAGRPGGRGWLCIPTGGSSGRLRFACHDQDTLKAAVEGFRSHFGLGSVNAVGVLPLHHVSGLMAWLRCALSGGQHLDWGWRALEEGRVPVLGEGDWVISLVPTQLQRLLQNPALRSWLGRFRVIFLGGAPAWPSLLEEARAAGLPLSLSYGMTETAAMVAALRPVEFLSGSWSSGTAMPHACVRLSEEGLVCISGSSLMRGYLGGEPRQGDFVTQDLGRLDGLGRLHIEGRSDAVIITGAEKVSPVELEAQIRAAGWNSDLAVIGLPDPDWGSRVVACVPPGVPSGDFERVQAVLRGSLASFKRPKEWIVIDPWPRSAQGKINRARLAELALSPSASRVRWEA
jgi:O-succinylbenzoic acid--CoA ligase